MSALARHSFTCVPQQNIIWHNWLSKKPEVPTSKSPEDFVVNNIYWLCIDSFFVIISQPISELFSNSRIRAYTIWPVDLANLPCFVVAKIFRGPSQLNIIFNNLDGKHGFSFPVGTNGKSPSQHNISFFRFGIKTSVGWSNSSVLTKIQHILAIVLIVSLIIKNFKSTKYI